MYRTILFIVVAAAAQAQTVEGPARITDIESRRTQRIEQHAAEVGKLMQKVEALSRMHQANPGDLVTEQQLEGEKTRVALAIKKFEDDLASYSDALADEVEHQARDWRTAGRTRTWRSTWTSSETSWCACAAPSGKWRPGPRAPIPPPAPASCRR